MEAEIIEEEIILELIADPVVDVEIAETEIVVEIGNGGASWGSITGILANQTDLSEALAGKSDTGHIHDDRYYTETEIDAALAGKSDTDHIHDDRYYTETEIDAALAGKSDTDHIHDDRYYTESEIDAALAGKSDTGHIHDDRYYTETEIDTKLAGKSDTGHTHNNIIDPVQTGYSLGLKWSGEVTDYDYPCVWASYAGYTKVIQAITPANFKKKLSSSLPTIKKIEKNIGSVTLGSGGYASIESHMPAAPTGYTFLFASLWNYGSTTSPNTAHGVIAKGTYMLGAANSTLSDVWIAYFYILTENLATS